MHDPLTVALEIKRPWPIPRKEQLLATHKYYPPIITIWHVDPEKDGSDDSCDWFGHKKKLSPEEREVFDCLWNLETILDNKPHFPDSREHKEFQPLKQAIWKLKKRKGWRIHPRWHVWHWRIQIHPIQEFKRWAFSRCSKCGGRFKWGESVCSNNWNSTGPRWFRSEDVYHMNHEQVAVENKP